MFDISEEPTVLRHRHCQACAGSGVCPRCDGWGRLWSIMHGRSHRQRCPECSGVGACPRCAGRGRPGAASLCGLLRRWRQSIERGAVSLYE